MWARHALTTEEGEVATQLTEGLEVFDGHKLGLLSETALKSGLDRRKSERRD